MNRRIRHSRVGHYRLSDPVKAYDGEDVRSFEGDIVLELLESNTYTTLIEGYSRVARKNPGMIKNLHSLH